jgi:hypothetical protein
MQFVVPQFIDVEDKVLGPLSVRQFITLLIGAGSIFVLFKLLPFFTFVLAAIFVLILVFVFAFVKINGRPFHFFLLSLVQTYRRPQLKIWKKDAERYLVKKEREAKKDRGAYVPQTKGSITSSRLAQLTLVVDTGGTYELEEEEQEGDTNPRITTLKI